MVDKFKLCLCGGSSENAAVTPLFPLETNMFASRVETPARNEIKHARLGPDGNGGAAGSTNASDCRACPAGSYSHALGSRQAVNHHAISECDEQLHFRFCPSTVQDQVISDFYSAFSIGGLDFV